MLFWVKKIESLQFYHKRPVEADSHYNSIQK